MFGLFRKWPRGHAFRYWDGRSVCVVDGAAIIAKMWQRRPDLGLLLDRYEQLESPWALESCEVRNLIRVVFQVPELTDPSGRTPGLTDVEVLGLMGRFVRFGIKQRLAIRIDL